MTAQNEKSSNKDRQNVSDFSVEHILNRAGNNKQHLETDEQNEKQLSWLQCTRYCPPRIPRLNKKNCNHKRQLGRYPRIPFTSHQLTILEEKFRQSPYLSSEDVINLARKLQLADVRVKIWFQNRRARERREQTQTKIQIKSETLSLYQEATTSQQSDWQEMATRSYNNLNHQSDWQEVATRSYNNLPKK